MRITIDSLSRDELFSLIYHHIPQTHFIRHPVFCVACGHGYEGDFVVCNGREVEALGYICDRCEENNID